MAKNKKSILNELFETRNSHSEEAEEIKKEDFIKTIKSRRSVRNYNDEPVLEQDMKACLELALLAPNSSNLQPWEFYWVRSPEKKQKLVSYCLGQPAAATAQELVVAVARPDYWKVNQKRMLELIENLNKCISVQNDLNTYRLEDWKKMDKNYGLYLDDERIYGQMILRRSGNEN